MIDINKLVRENIKQLKPYSSARDEFKGSNYDMVFLDANENPFGNGINRYPDPRQEMVKSKLSELKGVSSDNMLLGNGSDEVIDLILRAFCEPKVDNVLLLPPTYGMYKVSAGINAVETLNAPLDDEFQPDVDLILQTITANTKVIFLCSPNNPSGNSFSKERIEMLLNNFKGLVVIDEAYIDFSESSGWIGRLKDYAHLVVMQTFSKAFGMAGIRLGICYASKQVIEILNKIKPPYNVNDLTQNKALTCLDEYESVQQQIEEIRANRTKLILALEELSVVTRIYPSDANFILLKVDNADRRYLELIEKGIVVRNRSNQKGCEDCLRLTVGTKKENERLIEALKELT